MASKAIKVCVWTPPKDRDPSVRLRLFDGPSGDKVVLMAVGEEGMPIDRGCLIDITAEGYRVWSLVSPLVGMPLDDHDRIKEIP